MTHMNTNEVIAQIRELVESDELEQAIAVFRQHKDILDIEDHEAEIISFVARLNSLSREHRLGIIDADRYRIDKNQIRLSIIELLLSVEKEVNLKPPPPPPVPEQKRQPTDGDELIEQATALYTNGKYKEAEVLMKRALASPLKVYPMDEAFTILGNIYNQMDRFQESIEAHQNALELNPDSFRAWTNLGVVYRLTAQYEKAEECYLKALKINPDYAEVHASLGALYITYTMEFEKAIKHLKKAIELDPGLAISYSNLALALASVGKFDEAEKNLKLAVLKGYTNAERLKTMIDNLKSL